MKRKTVVIKVGTAIVTKKSDSLNHKFIKHLVDEISNLMNEDVNVVLVSSGAVASGRHELKKAKFSEDLNNIAYKQLISAVGQGGLLHEYYELFKEKGFQTAQVLLTDTDFNNRVRYLNIRNTFDLMLKNKIVPIVNENDVTSTQELTVGDNDFLAAYVALMLKADLLLILTDVDGLCSDNPKVNKDTVSITHVTEINSHIRSLAKKNKQESRGLGGMSSKIDAADLVTNGGIPTIVTNGKKLKNLKKIVVDNQLEIGTYFSPKMDRMTSRKSWLSSKVKKNAKIKVDEGAKDALKMKGKSLLPAGIKGLDGGFERGDVVEVWFKRKKIGYGQVNYDFEDLKKIVGKKSSEIKKILPQFFGSEVIHRDDLVLT